MTRHALAVLLVSVVIGRGTGHAAPCDGRPLELSSSVQPCESIGACQIASGAVCSQSYDSLNVAQFPGACELSCAPMQGSVTSPETNMICDSALVAQGGDDNIADTPYCGLVPTHAPGSPGAAPPNIVFVVSDDWGFPYYEDVVHGSTTTNVWHDYFSPTLEPNRMRLPNLRSLAEQGAYFPVAHQCSSICAPGSSCAITGRHAKDFEAPTGSPNGVVMSQTVAHRLRGQYCSIKAGKVWQEFFAEDATPAVGFDFDTGRVSNNSSFQPGTTKRSLEEVACLMRKVNASRRPFFVHYQPVIPHPPSNIVVPADFGTCYGNDAPFYRLNGGTQILPTNYRQRQSYLDCGVGRLLKFLTDTPDERYPAGAGKMLIDTTLIVYMTDNGSILVESKGYFSENGYRTPMIFTLHDRTDPSSPSNIHARSYQGTVVSVLDAVATAIDFANTGLASPLPTGAVPPLGAPGAPPAPPGIAAPEIDAPPPEHLGLPLRTVLTSPTPSPIRTYQLGHFAQSNSLGTVRGLSQTYLRTQTYSVAAPFDTSGMPAGSCRTALTTPPARFACKYYQKPVANQSRCTQLLYDVVSDPEESTNLLSDACKNPANPCYANPCRCLYANTDNALPPPPGKPALYGSLKCELVRWTRLDPALRAQRGGGADVNRGCAFQNTETGDKAIEIGLCL